MSEEEQFNEDEELDLSQPFLMMNSSSRCTMIFMMV